MTKLKDNNLKSYFFDHISKKANKFKLQKGNINAISKLKLLMLRVKTNNVTLSAGRRLEK